MSEDEPRILWRRDGMRCVRYGTIGNGFLQFESAQYNDVMDVIGWQEVTASQIGLLLDGLGEYFECVQPPF